MMNFGFYHPSHNPYGCKRSSDNKYWYNTTVTFNTTADCFNPSKLLTDSGTIASGKSGRDDGRYGDAVYEGGLGGIIDWRLPAVANDSPEEAAKVEAKVENGTYRGLEKLVWTYVTIPNPENNIVPLTTSGVFAYDSNNAGGTIGVHTTSQGGVAKYAYSSVYSPNVTHYILYGDNGESAVIKKGIVGSSKVVAFPYNNEKIYIYSVENNIAELNAKFPIGTTISILAISEYKTNLSVSGEFNTQMVIGDPANILLTDALKDGWLGTWCPVIPDGTNKFYPRTRKAIDAYSTYQESDDNGTYWASGNYTLDTVKNGYISSFPTQRVFVTQYKAFAKQTKPSTNKPVYNAKKGLLGVTVTQSHDKSVLAEAVAGIILKSDASGIVTEQSSPVKFLVDEVIERITSLATDMVAPANSSQAIKIAAYQISENGQVSLGFIANTMTHNGTDWGELDEIIIPFGDLEVDTFNDANGILQTTQSTLTAIPMGWTSNHARAGEQVEGVDL